MSYSDILSILYYLLFNCIRYENNLLTNIHMSTLAFYDIIKEGVVFMFIFNFDNCFEVIFLNKSSHKNGLTNDSI